MNKTADISVFKSYDIRGIYPDEITPGLAYKIGRALVEFLKAKTITVGRDYRLGGDELHRELVRGLTEAGANVIDIGHCSTPFIYFAVSYLKTDGAVMVTASHNPKEYNGFKITREKAIPICGDSGLKDIEKIVKKNKFANKKKIGQVIEKNITVDYIDFVKGFLADNLKKIKIAVDSVNGPTGPYIAKVLKDTPVEVEKLFFKPDGNFPNHDPNPMAEGSLNELIKKVKSGLEFGAAVDADGDRIFFVDEKGEKVPADLITALLASQYQGEKILYDLRSSNIVSEAIKAIGSQPIITRVGHSFIKEKMRKEKAVFAGEVSGHYYYQEANYTDSAVITLVKMINLLSREGKKMSELIAPLQKYFQSGEINFKVKNKEEKMKELKEQYKDGRLLEIDGVRVDYPDWWFNVRASNTEPLLRLNLEAESKKLMKEKVKEISMIIRN